jgi:Cytochrome c554 and c-prime
MKKPTTNLSAFLIMALAAAFFVSKPAVAHAHSYVGESTCEQCHDSTHEALTTIKGPDGNPSDPVTVWKADHHSQAYNNLVGSARAAHAASVAHIADPSTTQNAGSMCLTCHATGTDPTQAGDGVSCEACHGPASDYQSAANHGAITDAASMQAAVALGLIDMRKMDVREQNCRGCHVIKRPCYLTTDPAFDVHDDKKFRHWRDNVPVL